MKHFRRTFAFLCILLFADNIIFAQTDDLNDYNEPPSRLRGVIEKFAEDYGSLDRFYTARESQNRAARLGTLYADWQNFLTRQNFDALSSRRRQRFCRSRARSAISKTPAGGSKPSTRQKPPRC
jgi:hypothetical protein